MAPISREDDSDVPVVVGRRSARLSVIVPITVRGTDANGQTFKENTWTIAVNKHGGRLATFHQLAPGDQVVIENPVLGRTSKARVIRVCEKRFPEDPYEICVELMEAQNVWGVKFPPEDWQKERPTAVGTRPVEKAPGPAPTPRPASPSIGTARAAETGKPAEVPPVPPPESGERPEKFNQFNLALTALSRFAQQADAAAPPRPSPPEDKQAEPARQIVPPARVSLQDAVKHLEDLAHSLEQEFATLMDRLRVSRVDLEGLLSKAQGVQQDWQSEIEKARKNIQQASWLALQSALETLDERAREKLESALTSFTEETRKRVQAETGAALEAFSKEVRARRTGLTDEGIAKLTSELQASQIQATERAKSETTRLIETTTVGLNEKFKKSVDEMLPLLRTDMEKSLEKSAAQLIGRLTQSFQEQIQRTYRSEESSLRQSLQKIQREIREEVANAAVKARQHCAQEAEAVGTTIGRHVDTAIDSLNAATEEAAAKLQTASQRMELSVKEQVEDYRKQLATLSATALEGFRNHAEAQLKGLQAEVEEALRKSEEKHAKESSGRLQKIGEEVLESSAQELQKQANDGLEMFSEQLQTSGKELIEETQKQFQALTQTTLASLAEEAKAAAEEYRAELQKTLQELHDRSAHDLEAHLQTTLDTQRESIRAHLQKEADSTRERTVTRIKSESQQVVQESSDMMYKQVGVAAAAMKDWTDGARARLETYFQKSMELFQEQIGDLSKAALEKHRTEAAALANGLHDRLQQAARLVGVSEAVDAKPPKVPDDLYQTSPPQLRPQAEEHLDPFAEQLKARQEQVVRDATEAFRKKLAEILGSSQPTVKTTDPKR